MKLIINTASTYKGGGIQVARSFIEECKNFSENKYFVILSTSLSKMLKGKDFPENFTFFNAPFRPATRIFSFQSHNRFLKEIENKFNPDVVFTTSGPSYWRPRTPHVMGYNIPHYIYPESPYFKKISLKRKLWWKAMKFVAYFNFKYNADVYVVQTDDVSERLKKFIKKDKVYTVYNTVNAHFLDQIKVKNKLPPKKPDEFRLLTLSAWYPHKNLSSIPKIVEALKGTAFNIKFVLTLPEEDFEKISVNMDGSERAIINVGPVKIEEAPSLYKECDAMFLPTFLECFSASYVEAMMMKKPIVTSDLGFARTVCRDAALYIDPVNPVDIADIIIQLKNSKALQEELIENGIKILNTYNTAQERAKKYLDICKMMFDTKRDD